MGFFYRTIRMVENGIKPAYVFDGKPPELKAGVVRAVLLTCVHSFYVTLEYQLSKRFERREEAKEENEEAKETGTAEDMDRFSRRTVKVTREHNEECRRLLTLMGIPFVVVRIPQAFLNGALTNRSGRTRAGTLRSRSPVCRTRARRKG